MKKLLLATGILALSVTAFGAAATTANGYATDDVLVKAKVVTPLQVVKKTDLDLGMVLVNETKATIVSNGLVEVIGDKNANVKVEIEGNDFVDGRVKQIPVTLNNTTQGATGTMEVAVDLKTTQGTTDVFSLGTTGVLPLEFTGNITKAATVPGDYSGTVHVRAKYN